MDPAEVLSKVIQHIRMCHPAFRDITIHNAITYIPILIPHLLLEEAKRENSILRNPFIRQLAGDAGAAFTRLCAHDHVDSVSFITLTMYAIEQSLFTRHPRIRQIVEFGSVMSTYPYWMQDLSDCVVFQLCPNQVLLDEFAEVMTNAKAKLVARERHAILVSMLDARWQDLVLANGFDPSMPTLWILNGWISIQSEEDGKRSLELIDELSSPHSQIYADMCSGHRLSFKLADDAPEVVIKPGAGEVYGVDASVFRPLKEWRVELLFRRNEDREYNGSMWTAVTEHLSVTDPKEATLGPFYMVRFSKQP